MSKRERRFKDVALAFVLAVAIIPGIVTQLRVSAVQLQTRQLRISSDIASKTGVQYELSFGQQSAGPVGSLKLQLCSNDPFPGTPCTAPDGLDFSAATLLAQTGMTGFSIDSQTTANEIVLTRTPGVVSAIPVSYTFGNITNPSTSGATYARIQTFASPDGSGPSHDDAGLVIWISPEPLAIKSYVPPFLIFCVGTEIVPRNCASAQGNYINFGEFSATATSTAQTKLMIATNAEFGYTIRAVGPTLISGTNIIPNMPARDVSRKGTSQFGLNLRANHTPPAGADPTSVGQGSPTADYNTPDYFKFVSGDVIASYDHPDDYRLYTVNYIVNIAKDQAPGVYVSTLTYIALATF